jgi:ADP-heptose:LPS heptosyltransferase
MRMILRPFLRLFKALRMCASLLILYLRSGAGGSKPQSPPERILVLGYSAVGDFIFLLPALRRLRNAFPQARIAFVADRYFVGEQFAPATGLFDEVHKIEIVPETAGERERAARLIREGRFDAAIVSHPTPFGFFAHALLSVPVRIGHCRPLEPAEPGWSFPRLLLWRLKRGLISDEFARRIAFTHPVWLAEDDEHQVSRNLRLVAPVAGPAPDGADAPPELPVSDAARRKAEELLGDGAPRVVGVHIGSPKSMYGKIWSAENWGKVCRLLGSPGAIRFVLLGGPDEDGGAKRFGEALGGDFIDLAGRCSLSESFAALERCDLFLGNDTGMTKASMALGVPTATLWGPSDRPGYGIYWDPEKHLELYRELPCSPCVRMGLPQEGPNRLNYANCGHHNCLNEWTPEAAAERIRGRFGPILGA